MVQVYLGFVLEIEVFRFEKYDLFYSVAYVSDLEKIMAKILVELSVL